MPARYQEMSQRGLRIMAGGGVQPGPGGDAGGAPVGEASCKVHVLPAQARDLVEDAHQAAAADVLMPRRA